MSKYRVVRVVGRALLCAVVVVATLVTVLTPFLVFWFIVGPALVLIILLLAVMHEGMLRRIAWSELQQQRCPCCQRPIASTPQSGDVIECNECHYKWGLQGQVWRPKPRPRSS